MSPRHSLPSSSSSPTSAHPHHPPPVSAVSEGSDSVTSPDSGDSFSSLNELRSQTVAPPPPTLLSKTLPSMSHGSTVYSYVDPSGQVNGYVPTNGMWDSMEAQRLEQMGPWNMAGRNLGVRGVESRDRQHPYLHYGVKMEFAREQSAEGEGNTRSPHVSRKLPKPPREAFASPSSIRRHLPHFPLNRPPMLELPGYTCSQSDGSSLPSPLMTVHQKPASDVASPSDHFHQEVSPATALAYSLSQEAYVSSPPSTRRPAFQRPRLTSASLSQGMAVPHSAVPSSFSRSHAQPAFERSCLSQDEVLSGPSAQHPSAFTSPILPPRRIPQPRPPAPPPPQHLTPPSHHPGNSSHPLQVSTVESTNRSSSEEDPSPSGFSAGSSATTGSSNASGDPQERGGDDKGKGVELREDGGRRRREEKQVDGMEYRVENLSGVQLLDLLARISDPNCTVTKLE